MSVLIDHQALERSFAWSQMESDLSSEGFAITERVLSQRQCNEIISWFDDDNRFRKTVNMQQHRFGRGIYKYFSYPLPDIVQHLRAYAYPKLATCANAWNEAQGKSIRYPQSLEAFLELCHKKGQNRPTPLLLKYEVGDFNCLHQDLYGDILFPIQMTFLLSEPGRDFEGGEFVLTEARPRCQSKVEVIPLKQGQAVIFAVNQRPASGAKGVYRVSMRHGVSKLRAGRRFAMGIIFHDAS